MLLTMNSVPNCRAEYTWLRCIQVTYSLFYLLEIHSEFVASLPFLYLWLLQMVVCWPIRKIADKTILQLWNMHQSVFNFHPNKLICTYSVLIRQSLPYPCTNVYHLDHRVSICVIFLKQNYYNYTKCFDICIIHF